MVVHHTQLLFLDLDKKKKSWDGYLSWVFCCFFYLLSHCREIACNKWVWNNERILNGTIIRFLLSLALEGCSILVKFKGFVNKLRPRGTRASLINKIFQKFLEIGWVLRSPVLVHPTKPFKDKAHIISVQRSQNIFQKKSVLRKTTPKTNLFSHPSFSTMIDRQDFRTI